MFDKLVESAKQKQGRRARRLFLATVRGLRRGADRARRSDHHRVQPGAGGGG